MPPFLRTRKAIQNKNLLENSNFERVPNTLAKDLHGINTNMVFNEQDGAIFNGNSDISILDSDGVIRPDYRCGYAIEVWLKATERPVDNSISECWNGGGKYAWSLRHKTAGLVFAIYDNTNNPSYTYSGAWEDGNWHHIVCVKSKSDGTIKMYIDGVLVGSVPDTTVATTVSNEYGLHLGTRTGLGSYNWTGSMKGFKFYDVEISQSDVTTLYNNGQMLNAIDVQLKTFLQPLVSYPLINNSRNEVQTTIKQFGVNNYVDGSLGGSLNELVYKPILDFNGINNYVLIDKSTAKPLIPQNTSCTVVCRVRPKRTTTERRIITKLYGSSLNDRAGSLFYNPPNKCFRFYMVDNANTNPRSATTTIGALDVNLWYFVVANYDAPTGNMYIRVYDDSGTLLQSATAVASANDTPTGYVRALIGTELDTGSPVYAGMSLSKMLVYNSSLTTGEADALALGQAHSKSNLVAEYLFDEVTGGKLKESVSGYYQGTIYGATWLSQQTFDYHFYNNNGLNAVCYDTTERYNGNASIKLDLLKTGSFIECRYKSKNYFSTKGIRVKPNTKYKISFAMKTKLISGTCNNGAKVSFLCSKEDGSMAGVETGSTEVKTTTDWTRYEFTLVTNKVCAWGHPELHIYGHTGAGTLVMSAWFADVVVEEVESLFSSLYFNGSTHQVALPNVKTLQFPTGNLPITVSAKVKPSSAKQLHTMLSLGNEIILRTTSTNQFEFVLNSFTANDRVSGGTVKYDQWQTVTGVYDGTTISLYVNETLVGSIVPTGTYGGDLVSQFLIGAGVVDAEDLVGELRNVIVLRKGLSAQQVSDWANFGRLPKNVLDKQIEWLINGDATDTSGNGNHGIVTGASLVVDADGNANGAYHFTGGQTNYIVPTNNNFNIANQDATRKIIACRIKSTQTAHAQEIWAFRLGIGLGECMRLYTEQTTGYPFIWKIKPDGSGTTAIKPSVNVLDGAWHTIITEFNLTTGITTLWIDGIKYVGGSTSLPRDSKTFEVNWTGASYTDIDIDNILVAKSYETNGFEDYGGIWLLDDATGNPVDSSGNGNDGVITGATWKQTAINS